MQCRHDAGLYIELPWPDPGGTVIFIYLRELYPAYLGIKLICPYEKKVGEMIGGRTGRKEQLVAATSSLTLSMRDFEK